MKKVEFAEILDILEYEKVRDAARARNIEVTRYRRLSVGDRLTFLFENHDTVWFQVQEMIRTERIVDEARIREEIDVYDGLIPGPGELSATLFIEIPEIVGMDRAEVRRLVDRFLGLERDAVHMELGGRRVPARFEEGRSEEERMSAVHFLRFALDADARWRLADPAQPARLAVSHPNYMARQDVPPEMRAELLADLG
jgi:hypothetical protein